MPRTSTRAAAGLLIALTFLAFLAAAPAAGQDDRPTVRVGVFSVEPIVFLDGDGRPQGVYVDLIEAVAEQEGWRLQYVPGTWNEGLERLKAGRIDLMTSVSYATERLGTIAYGSQPVMMIWGQVYTRPEAGVQSVLDLDGRKVAVAAGDLNGENFRTLVGKFGLNCTIREAATHDEVFGMIARGQVSAGVVPNVYGYGHAPAAHLVGTSIIFDPLPTHFAAPLGRGTHLLAAVDRHLAAWKQDESSVYYAVLDKWLGGGRDGRGGIPRWLAVMLASVMGLVLLLTLWNRVLDRQFKARTRQLRESEAKLRTIFDQSFQFIGLLDPQGRVLDVNRTALDFAGVQPGDVTGRFFWDTVWWSHSAEAMDTAREAVAAAAAGGMFHGRTAHFDASGEFHDIDFSVTNIRDEAGRVVLLVAEGHDVTEIQRLEANLRQAQRLEAVGTLAAGIAHDFNNILSAIFGYTELAQLRVKGDRPTEECLEEVLRGADRARELVQQILAFGRRSEQKRRPMAMGPVVQEALRLIKASVPSTITIEENVGPCDQILGDPSQVHQVVMNLCTNAYQAMESGSGRLRVSLRQVRDVPQVGVGRGELPPAAGYVLLEVADTGQGMDPATLDKIFEPYFTTKEPGKGTGLGLAMVHGIVKDCQGVIEVTSSPGRGSTFRVTLPVLGAQGAAPQEAAPRVGAAGGEHILFVDDEVALVKLAESYFTGKGYRVTALSDSSRALDVIRNDPEAFDLLITDQTMPRVTGMDLAAAFRVLRPTAPIILCTGFGAELDGQDLDDLGIDALLQKPVAMGALTGRARELLDECCRAPHAV
ncbi:transporter substrate-binding domain-containing protein [bacterium]|nr:transporter substrate-binding domain-containing protein [bacterium]